MRERARVRDVFLVPVDFDGASLRALDLAKEIAPLYGGEVVLLHAYVALAEVYPGLSPAETPSWPGIHMEVAAAAKRALDALALDAGGLRSILSEGDPARAILDEVARLRPRMVVMGTHRRAGLAQRMLGSVAKEVVRRSAAPVLVAK